jgi:hypothetical protein
MDASSTDHLPILITRQLDEMPCAGFGQQWNSDGDAAPAVVTRNATAPDGEHPPGSTRGGMRTRAHHAVGLGVFGKSPGPQLLNGSTKGPQSRRAHQPLIEAKPCAIRSTAPAKPEPLKAQPVQLESNGFQRTPEMR